MYMDSVKYNQKSSGVKTTGDKRMATIWSLVHAFIKFLVSAEYISKDIMEHSERPKIRNEAHRVFMEQDEIKCVIDKAHTAYITAKQSHPYYYEGWEARDLLALRMLMETGMRVTALTEINIEDIDMENKSVQVVDKRGKIHHHPLHPDTIIILKDWLNSKKLVEDSCNAEAQDALFISQKGKRRLAPEAINDIIKKYTSDLNKHITAHKFRGTYATTLYRATGDIYFVKECMGHTNVSTTQIYVEPKTDNKEKALEIMSKIMNS